jgi:hypothetical protein
MARAGGAQSPVGRGPATLRAGFSGTNIREKGGNVMAVTINPAKRGFRDLQRGIAALVQAKRLLEYPPPREAAELTVPERIALVEQAIRTGELLYSRYKKHAEYQGSLKILGSLCDDVEERKESVLARRAQG